MPKLTAQAHRVEYSVIEGLLVSYHRSLQARDLSKHTITAYVPTIKRFIAYLRAECLPLDPGGLSREHVEMYMAHLGSSPLKQTGAVPSSNTIGLHYRALRCFFKWLVEMDEIARSPMERMTPPRLHQERKPVLTVEQVRAIVRACEGKGFANRRDYAMVMLFIDTGIRRMEMASLKLDDIDWAGQSITVHMGKGRKSRIVYFGKRTLKALDQYVYLRGGRREHKGSHLPDLWLGGRGALSDDGIYRAIKYRGDKAGVPYIHPHLWRHYFIHASLMAGAQVGDLMRMTGHVKVETLLHYGESAADERAKESHRKLGPGDRL